MIRYSHPPASSLSTLSFRPWPADRACDRIRPIESETEAHKMGMCVCMWVFASLAVGIINPLAWHHVLCAVHSWKLKKIHSTGGLTAPSWDRCQASFWGGWTGDTRIQGLAGRCDICLWPPLPRRMQHKLSKCKLQIAWPSACGTKCAHNFKFITKFPCHAIWKGIPEH